MSYLRLGIIGAIALAFIALGIYAWDADAALAKCRAARQQDVIDAQALEARLKREDEERTQELTAKHDSEIVQLQIQLNSREETIRHAKNTISACPTLDAYLDSLRGTGARPSANAADQPASKSR